jgi:hypothetical protein
MESDLYNSIRELIKDIKKQLGNDNEVAKFVALAVTEKMMREKLNKFIEEEEDMDEHKISHKVTNIAT